MVKGEIHVGIFEEENFEVGSRGRRMTKRSDQGNDGNTAASIAVELDVLAILEQLGIDHANWPKELPPLHRS